MAVEARQVYRTPVKPINFDTSQEKRSVQQVDFALGIEALERFVNKEPLRRIYESVFGILALESEEVDPRL
ncbi:hypothetical protein [Eisenibacter elegans]|uniref:hypothetical protein n=1 Tax=Eisenibacter elegans TaxID=997 RepID=UPI0003FC313A|nr:hypothetical protein [Eisenibacter elegans]